MRRIRHHLTYANVMATIAVFGVLAGGGAYAASKVGTRDIQNGAVTAEKLHRKAVKTTKIATAAVTSEKIRSGQVGATALGRIRERSARSNALAPGISGSVAVQCHAGEQVVSGGSDFEGTDGSVVASRFQPPNGWAVFVQNEAATGNAVFVVHAYCLTP